jgi:YVTN family beta-propeller protein
LLCGNRGNRTVTIFDVEQSRVVAHLPVAVSPENFCFKAANDGELYVTGAGVDALVVIYPYQSEVYETRLVGRSPGAMAVSSSPEYLFVANTESDNVTVMNVETGKTIAVAVGAEPRHIAVTPDDQYALTLNRRSGDMAVIRIPAFENKDRAKWAPTPLFTMIPVGAKPVSAAIRRSSAAKTDQSETCSLIPTFCLRTASSFTPDASRSMSPTASGPRKPCGKANTSSVKSSKRYQASSGQRTRPANRPNSISAC